MRRPHGRWQDTAENPDVVDWRGASPPLELPGDLTYDGIAPLVYKADAQRSVRHAFIAGGVFSAVAFFLGRGSRASAVTSPSRRARNEMSRRSSRSRIG
jgi:hypothetical protein